MGTWWLANRQHRERAFVLVLVLAFTPTAARAQLVGDDDVPSAAERESLYRELARDAEAWEKQNGLLKRVVKLVGPTVVHIEALKGGRTSMGYGAVRGSIEEAGSGVVVELGGQYFVLTNRHVVKFAANERIKIKLADGRQIYPTQVLADPGTDIAVLAVNEPRLIPIRLGNSDNLEIGDFVLAVGSPFGLSHSVTYGIISAKGRRDLELGEEGVRFQDFIQTDAAINPGNSGGPLVNMRGELVGINTAIASSSGGNEGIGFTIPINMVMLVAKQLIQTGTVNRAFLGVNLDSKFTASVAARLGLARLQGARITGLTKNSPAMEAQLQVDDVVLRFNGVRIENDSHLVNLVGLTEIGKEIPIVIYRNRRAVELNVRVGDRSKYEEPPSSP